MQDLIAELKRDHVILFEHLETARRLGVDGPEARKAMMKARNTLMAHLQREDHELYPRLRQAAKTDREFAFLFRLMGEQMEDVSQQALDFFHRYEKGIGPSLASEFKTLCTRLQSRMRMEESDLYHYFERLQAGAAP